MDPGPSRLSTVQCPDEPILFLPQHGQRGQPTHDFFANAHDFEMNNPRFYDIQGGFHHHSGSTGNKTSLSPLSLPS
jgi:hypothetical protein